MAHPFLSPFLLADPSDKPSNQSHYSRLDKDKGKGAMSPQARAEEPINFLVCSQAVLRANIPGYIDSLVEVP